MMFRPMRRSIRPSAACSASSGPASAMRAAIWPNRSTACAVQVRASIGVRISASCEIRPVLVNDPIGCPTRIGRSKQLSDCECGEDTYKLRQPRVEEQGEVHLKAIEKAHCDNKAGKHGQGARGARGIGLDIPHPQERRRECQEKHPRAIYPRKDDEEIQRCKWKSRERRHQIPPDYRCRIILRRERTRYKRGKSRRGRAAWRREKDPEY